MKSKRRRRMRKMASERVLMDGYGQEYHIVEKRLPGRRKSVYDTYVVRQKRTGRDCLVEIMLQWLIRIRLPSSSLISPGKSGVPNGSRT